MKNIAIIALICITLTLSACGNYQMYSEQYGFAEDHPEVYSRHERQCEEEAYDRYPVISPPRLKSPPRDLPRSKPNEIAYANRVLQEIERINERMMDDYRDYNYDRDAFERKCMDRKGWHYVEVPETKDAF